MMCIIADISRICKAFFTFGKTVAIHRIMESKKIKGYRECAKQSFSIPLIVIPSDNIIHN